MKLLALVLAVGSAAYAQAPEAAPALPEAPAAAEAPAVPATDAADAPAAPSPTDAPAAAPGSALAIDPAELIGPPAGPPLSGEALREQTHAVAKLMRCPVCQGLSVADSPSESALAMKAEVQDLVARGYDAEQVLVYFEASYGEFIRLEPKFEGVNVLVWAAPVLLVLVGGGWVLWSAAASSRRAAASPVPASPTAASPDASTPADPAAPAPPVSASSPSASVDPALAEYLRRVREESR